MMGELLFFFPSNNEPVAHPLQTIFTIFILHFYVTYFPHPSFHCANHCANMCPPGDSKTCKCAATCRAHLSTSADLWYLRSTHPQGDVPKDLAPEGFAAVQGVTFPPPPPPPPAPPADEDDDEDDDDEAAAAPASASAAEPRVEVAEDEEEDDQGAHEEL
jgi:hypothetical protein